MPTDGHHPPLQREIIKYLSLTFGVVLLHNCNDIFAVELHQIS